MGLHHWASFRFEGRSPNFSAPIQPTAEAFVPGDKFLYLGMRVVWTKNVHWLLLTIVDLELIAAPLLDEVLKFGEIMLADWSASTAYDNLRATIRAMPQVTHPEFVGVPKLRFGFAGLGSSVGHSLDKSKAVALGTIEALAGNTDGFHECPLSKALASRSSE
jgi:hypothetical protein